MGRKILILRKVLILKSQNHNLYPLCEEEEKILRKIFIIKIFMLKTKSIIFILNRKHFMWKKYLYILKCHIFNLQPSYEEKENSARIFFHFSRMNGKSLKEIRYHPSFNHKQCLIFIFGCYNELWSTIVQNHPSAYIK